MLSLRLNPELDLSSAEYGYQVNLLWFDDGSLKGLACFMNLVGLVILDQQGSFGPDDFSHHRAKILIESMLEIPTIYKSQAGVGNFLDSQLARVVKQNQDAAAQPLSSFSWACLLKQMGADGTDDGLNFNEALELYNAHPLVQQAGDALDPGSLLKPGEVIIVGTATN